MDGHSPGKSPHLIHATACDVGSAPIPTLRMNKLRLREVRQFIQAHIDSAENQDFSSGPFDFRALPLNHALQPLLGCKQGRSLSQAVTVKARVQHRLQSPHPLWEHSSSSDLCLRLWREQCW